MSCPRIRGTIDIDIILAIAGIRSRPFARATGVQRGSGLPWMTAFAGMKAVVRAGSKALILVRRSRGLGRTLNARVPPIPPVRCACLSQALDL